MAGEPDDQRFRSFAERYVITRAATFRVGHEVDDGWAAVLDARQLYKAIRTASAPFRKPEQGPL